MKNKRDLFTFLSLVMVYFAALMLCAFLASGCSATRLHDKAIQKGYVHTVYVDTLRVAYMDTLYKDGKPYPVIKYRDSLIIKTNIEYIPKWRARFDSKRFADSLAMIRAMYKDSLGNALKTQKIIGKHEDKKDKQETKRTQSENKNGFADSIKWVAVLVFLLIIAFLLFRYAPKAPVE